MERIKGVGKVSIMSKPTNGACKTSVRFRATPRKT